MTIEAENENLPENDLEQDQQAGQDASQADVIEQAVLHPDERELTEALLADKEATDKEAAAAEEVKKAEEAAKVAAAQPATGEAEDPGKKPQVPVAALIATRKKGQEAETKFTQADAKLKLIAQLADTLTPEQLRAIAAGEQTVEEATAETAEDPHDLLDAKELDLEKKRQDGDIDAIEYTQGMQLIRKERRLIDRQEASQTSATERNVQVKETIAQASKKIAEDFPIVASLTKGDLEALKPAAAKLTFAGMEKEFGVGVRYNDLNPKHRLFFQWNLASVADKVFGEGKGPVSQQKPNGQPSKTAAGAPGAKEVIATSPAARAAAASAPARAREAAPPDLTEFSYSADTELGQLERSLATATDEEFMAAMGKHPELRKQLEGR